MRWQNTPPWEPQETDGPREPETTDELPIIIPTADESSTVDQALEAARHHENLFQRAGQLVHVCDDAKPPAGCPRELAGPQVNAMGPARLKEIFSVTARWRSVGAQGDDLVTIHPPAWVIKAALERPTYERVRVLESVLESPIVRSDGSLLLEPGYDPHTGLVLHWGGPKLDVPENPTSEEIKGALALIRECVQDFPFENVSHESVWIAALFTLFLRPTFRGPAPIFIVDASAPGSGKSLLCDLLALINRGHDMPRVSYPRNEDELRKKVSAMAACGVSSCLLDNINTELGDSVLDAALTSVSWSDRPLGKTEMRTWPLNLSWLPAATT